jgi:hypothetical protein
MGVGDTPSVKRMRGEMESARIILGVNRILRLVGLGSAELDKTREQLKDLRTQLDQMADYPDRFNRYFSKDGWLAHGSLSFDALKSAVDQYESSGPDAGTAVLMDYFSPENLDGRLFFLNWAKELQVRRRLVELAFEDYRAGRYHAAIPVLLMMIDGAVNDAVGKGFHADGIELDVWDSMTTADGSINNIKNIFQRSRRKTRTESITVPYRNGILHGMDLGYDNAVVAAKCWCFLFVVADWIVAKKSEGVRRAKFEEECRVPSWRELAQQLSANERAKVALEAWRPRELDSDYLRELNESRCPEADSPEATAIQFLDLWSRGNYGGISKLYWAADKPGSRGHAGEVREMLSDYGFDTYTIDGVSDEAPAISVVEATLATHDRGAVVCRIRLIYETGEGDVCTRGLPGAAWRVVWAQPDV